MKKFSRDSDYYVQEFDEQEYKELLAEEEPVVEKKKKKGSWVLNLLLIGCMGVFLYSGIQLYLIYAEYKEGDEKYEQVQNMAVTAPDGTNTLQDEQEMIPQYAQYFIDFEQLKKKNPDTVAWIRFDSPEIINYPVVQGENNQVYLRTAFDGEPQSMGTLFIEERNSGSFLDDNTIIYGHNMKNNSMFGDLSKYHKKEQFEQYPFFYIYKENGMVNKYQIVAARLIEASSENYQTRFINTKEKQAYIDEMLRTSMYDTKTSVDTDSKLVTLSTCTSDDAHRYILQGVLVEETEMISRPETAQAEK